MKIAVTSTGPELDAVLDPRFGRCQGFLMVDTDNMTFEYIENVGGSLGSGAGIQAARLMVERKVDAVLTGNCGPNAHQTLQAAGIEVYVGCSGTVKEAIESYKAGKLSCASSPNASSHSGMSRKKS